MKQRCLAIGGLALAAFLLVSPRLGSASVDGIKVIVNADVPSAEISADDLRSVFLGVKTSLKDGSHLKPVLEKGGRAHEIFVKDYLGKTESGLRTYYRSLVFAGKSGMPAMVATDAEVISLVARTRGAIGYISADTPAAGVKTLRVH